MTFTCAFLVWHGLLSDVKAASLLSLTAVIARAHPLARTNTFACDESRASATISRDAEAINSPQISLYRRDDGPVLISFYYPPCLSCGNTLSRGRFILAFRPVTDQVCEQLSWALPLCHILAAIIPFTGWRRRASRPHLQGRGGGSEFTVLSWVQPVLTIASGDLYRYHHITFGVFH